MTLVPSARLAALPLWAGLLLFLPGCQARPPVTPSIAPPRPASRSRDLTAPRVVTTPAYREARRRYARGDVRGAQAGITRLLAVPGLPPEDRAFLQRQQAICRQALPGKPSPTVPAPRTDPGASAPPPPRRPDQADCGPRALALVCQKLHVPTDIATLRRLAGTRGSGTTLAGLAQAARAVGLEADGVQMDRAALTQLEGPAIAWVDGGHYLAVLDVQGEKATVQDPNAARPEEIATETLLRRSGGILLRLARRGGAVP